MPTVDVDVELSPSAPSGALAAAYSAASSERRPSLDGPTSAPRLLREPTPLEHRSPAADARSRNRDRNRPLVRLKLTVRVDQIDDQPPAHILVVFPGIPLAQGGRYDLVVTRRVLGQGGAPLAPSPFFGGGLFWT